MFLRNPGQAHNKCCFLNFKPSVQRNHSASSKLTVVHGVYRRDCTDFSLTNNKLGDFISVPAFCTITQPCETVALDQKHCATGVTTEYVLFGCAKKTSVHTDNQVIFLVSVAAEKAKFARHFRAGFTWLLPET